jgi:hypothetical protein
MPAAIHSPLADSDRIAVAAPLPGRNISRIGRKL